MEQEAGKRSSVTVKTLKKVLKKAGLKTTGKKATLTRRAKKARLMGGFEGDPKDRSAASIVMTVRAKQQVSAEQRKAALDAGWTNEEIEDIIRNNTPPPNKGGGPFTDALKDAAKSVAAAGVTAAADKAKGALGTPPPPPPEKKADVGNAAPVGGRHRGRKH